MDGHETFNFGDNEPGPPTDSRQAGGYGAHDSRALASTGSRGSTTVNPWNIREPTPFINPQLAANGHAARLTARFGTLGSIAQGQSRTSLGRGTTLATASQGCSSKGGGGHSGPIPPPRIKPIIFKNGITLVMDRRLLDRILVGKNITPIFERIVEEDRLRIRPAIDKGASAKEVTNIITTKEEHGVVPGVTFPELPGSSGPIPGEPGARSGFLRILLTSKNLTEYGAAPVKLIRSTE
ncbi:hypothetical protein V8E36_001472 [Tilletia maclaganii]